MASTTITLRATYNPNLDTLYLRTPGCSGSYLDSEDGVFFFTLFDDRESETPCGFEIHFFSEALADKEIIPDLDARFSILGTEVRDASLDEVLQWAFKTYVEPQQRVGAGEYAWSEEKRLEAMHENRGEVDYDTGKSN